MVREWNENMQKDWDLNIFFREDWSEETGTTWENVITINPIVYTWDGERSDNWYTDILYTTTFAEARFLRSQYPEADYGMDWTDSLSNFLDIAPPRLKLLLASLPNANDTDKINELGGLRALPTNDG
jgi:hypothetical protein